MTIQKLVCVYLFFINILTFIVFSVDKFKASAHLWRIQEKLLLLLSVVGGLFGGWSAMILFRHKIKDLSFLPFMIFITVSWFVGIIVFLIKLKTI